MVRFFQKDNYAFTKIFNTSFEVEIRQSGYKADIPWNTLNSQVETMKRNGDYLWGAVYLSPFTKDRGPWYPVLRRIQQIAQRLNIQLIEKDTDDTGTSNYKARPSKNSELEHTAVTEAARKPQFQPDQQPAHTPEIYPTDKTNRTDENHKAQAPVLVTAGEKICLFCFEEGNVHPDLQISDELPPLLYRWSNVDSQGVNSRRFYQAGLFAEGTEYLHPHELPQGEFHRFVENHVRISKSLSPFISTSRTILAPMHRALRNGEGAIVSIIDQKKLNTPIYCAQTLVKTLKLKFKFYNGAAEYLVWGSIPKSAIVCSFKASSLLKISRENPEIEDFLQFENMLSFSRTGLALHQILGSGPGSLDYQTGATIGRLLFKLEVPYEYCKNVSQGMFYSWWMKRRGTWEDFHRGVEDGYYLLPATNTADKEMLDVPDIPDVSELAGPGFPESIHQSDEETVTNDDPRTPIDLFSAADSPPPSPGSQSPSPGPAVVKLFDGATKQWIAQQGKRNNKDRFPSELSEQTGSSAETAISIDDSDDEFYKVFSSQPSRIKDEPSIFGSSPPALIDLEEIVPKPIVTVNDMRTTAQGGSVPKRQNPHDQFAADRERVLRFWG
ncbi:hypothetical protein P170DRAFT_413787 [Aspergillus steynii IBT 23096]|uniref:DUF7587 domain-containing protein n=1 Tax=Aspergillus steynii IBT 23096 TaxID=1392250 RepID=A0A2I2FY03_9EURO|nr:uncharacterized protein P170DRAFT_413787 [Aspergillus steynii IBT 23096]PLB45511.1 hypothetical protein P170DRAFT_413787 [Aspergillus steynii IBT 23096]